MSRMRVLAVGEFPLITGFALAGIPVIETESREEAVARLAEVLQHEDLGIVVAEPAVVQALPEFIRRKLARQSTPILLSLNTPDWSAEPEGRSSEILDLLQRAIGYRVRLQ